MTTLVVMSALGIFSLGWLCGESILLRRFKASPTDLVEYLRLRAFGPLPKPKATTTFTRKQKPVSVRFGA